MNYMYDKKVNVVASQAAKDGNYINGDSYYYYSSDSYFICVLADGLGSGPYAHESSKAVISAVREFQDEDMETIMAQCNKFLVNKRGAAVLVIKIYFDTNELKYCCVGNIRFQIYLPTGKAIYPLPISGYLSGKPQNFQIQTISYEPSSKFIIYTDGFMIKNVKSVLGKQTPIHQIAEELCKNLDQPHLDDATFVLGTILE